MLMFLTLKRIAFIALSALSLPVVAVPNGSAEKPFVQAGAGAVLRSFADKLADAVNARDFGAKCDNTADDTAAIKNAIASLGARGGTVALPPGSCRFTSKIMVSTPVLLRGASRAAYLTNYATRLVKAGNFVGIEFAQGSAFGGLADLTLDRSGADSSDGVYVSSGRIDMRNVTIQNQGRYGINVYDANASNFSALQIVGNGSDGLHIGGNMTRPDTNGMFFYGLDIRTNGGHGINIAKGFSNFFYGVTIQGNGGAAVRINDANNLFYGVYSENNTGKFLSLGPNAVRNIIRYGVASDSAAVTDASGTNSWSLPGDARSMENLGSAVVQTRIQIGNSTNGAPGYMLLKDTGSSYALTLEGTSASLTMPIKSNGGGKLTLDVDALAIDASTAPTLLNKWTNFAGSRKAAGYYKDKFGLVHLEGTVKGGTIGAAIFTLPAGYRPLARAQYAVASLNGTAWTLGIVIVDNDGNVYAQSGGNTEFALDNVQFKTVP